MQNRCHRNVGVDPVKCVLLQCSSRRVVVDTVSCYFMDIAALHSLIGKVATVYKR